MSNLNHILTVSLCIYAAFILGVVLGGFFILNLQSRRKAQADSRPEKLQPAVIWFTGLSGAGKTTISDILTDKIKTLYKRTEHLDGDVIREFFPRTGFTRKDRDDHIRRVAYLAACLQRYDVMVIASLISPYEDSRQFARKLCKNFVEVYVSTSLSVCEQRDVKGLYAKARSGEISHFTGIDEPYEKPSAPEITIDTSETSADQAADIIIDYIQKKYGDV